MVSIELCGVGPMEAPEGDQKEGEWGKLTLFPGSLLQGHLRLAAPLHQRSLTAPHKTPSPAGFGYPLHPLPALGLQMLPATPL